MTSDEIKRDLQKVFEFVVKNRGKTLGWDNADIRKFIRWAVHYRKLFLVYAPAGTGQRIVALGVAWRTESIGPIANELTFENTEFGNNLYVFQTIIHQDFERAGMMFQLLSLALLRYPGVENVFWHSEHHSTGKIVKISVNRLLNLSANQVAPKKLTKYIRKSEWDTKTSHPKFPTLKFLR